MEEEKLRHRKGKRTRLNGRTLLPLLLLLLLLLHKYKLNEVFALSTHLGIHLVNVDSGSLGTNSWRPGTGGKGSLSGQSRGRNARRNMSKTNPQNYIHTKQHSSSLHGVFILS